MIADAYRDLSNRELHRELGGRVCWVVSFPFVVQTKPTSHSNKSLWVAHEKWFGPHSLLLKGGSRGLAAVGISGGVLLPRISRARAAALIAPSPVVFYKTAKPQTTILPSSSFFAGPKCHFGISRWRQKRKTAGGMKEVVEMSCRGLCPPCAFLLIFIFWAQNEGGMVCG